MAIDVSFPEDRRARYAVIGRPVGHSLSPAMQERAFAEAGISACYRALEVGPEDLVDLRAAFEALGVLGFNVTAPLKEAVRSLIDSEDEVSSLCLAVNTVKCENGRWHGFNTDVHGVGKCLEEIGLDIEEKEAVILGSGGSARAVAVALEGAGIGRLHVRCRRESSGREVARLMKTEVETSIGPLDAASIPAGSTLIVNALPSFHGESPLVGIDPRELNANPFVLDLNYVPSVPPFLEACRRCGLEGTQGLGVLLHQGMASFEVWTGRIPSRSAMSRALGASSS